MEFQLVVEPVQDKHIPLYAELYRTEPVPDPSTTSESYFRWKFLKNPQGQAVALHLFACKQLVGLFVMMPRVYRGTDQKIVCAYAVNLLIEKSQRNIRTLNALLKGLGTLDSFDFLMSSPNRNSIEIWKRFLRYPIPFDLQVHAVPLRPLSLLAKTMRPSWLHALTPLDSVGGCALRIATSTVAIRSVTVRRGWQDIASVVNLATTRAGAGLAGEITTRFLEWRFRDAPMTYELGRYYRDGKLVAAIISRRMNYAGIEALVLLDFFCAPCADWRDFRSIRADLVAGGISSGAEIILTLGNLIAPAWRGLLRFPFLPVLERFSPQPTPLIVKQLKPGIAEFTAADHDFLALNLSDFDMF